MNYLQILQITPSSSIAEVKSAYRQLARKYHPDIGGNASSFIQLQKAYEFALNNHKPVPKPVNIKTQAKYYFILDPHKFEYTVQISESQLVRDTTLFFMFDGDYKEFRANLPANTTFPLKLHFTKPYRFILNIKPG